MKKPINYICCRCGRLFVEYPQAFLSTSRPNSSEETYGGLCGICSDIFLNNPSQRLGALNNLNQYPQMFKLSDKIMDIYRLSLFTVSEQTVTRPH